MIRIVISFGLLVLVVFSQFVESARSNEEAAVMDKIQQAIMRQPKDRSLLVTSYAGSLKNVEKAAQSLLDSHRRSLQYEMESQLASYERAWDELSSKRAQNEKQLSTERERETGSIKPYTEAQRQLVDETLKMRVKCDRWKIRINRLKYRLETLESESI